MVLGQNRLSDLRDKVACFRQEVRIGEFSARPEAVDSAPLMKDAIPAGYFLIEDVLYEDRRQAASACAQPAVDWSRDSLASALTTRSMHETRFDELSVRLGFPYLYKHLGNCEHLVVFTSVKLVNPQSDCYVLSKYPIPKDRTRGRFTFCWCCNRLYAKWVVCGSQMAVDDPTFLCERCFKNLHYELVGEGAQADEGDGEATDMDAFEEKNPRLKKIGEFKAYHFSQL